MRGTDRFGNEWWRWSCSNCGWSGWVRASYGYQATHRCGKYSLQPSHIDVASDKATDDQ